MFLKRGFHLFLAKISALVLELPVLIYGCNNIALVVSTLIDSGATYSFIGRFLVHKLKSQLV